MISCIFTNPVIYLELYVQVLIKKRLKHTGSYFMINYIMLKTTAQKLQYFHMEIDNCAVFVPYIKSGQSCTTHPSESFARVSLCLEKVEEKSFKQTFHVSNAAGQNVPTKLEKESVLDTCTAISTLLALMDGWQLRGDLWRDAFPSGLELCKAGTWGKFGTLLQQIF